jgi:polyhydroxybutyrate depolymerase
MKEKLLLMLLIVLVTLGCKKDKTPGYDFGKNRFTTEVDGDTREYFVHVPESYDPKEPIPVVFMLHGTSGDGLKFYNISGWKELGETEGILTVYPSSWHYCVVDEGQVVNTTKWNSFPGGFSFCGGETPRDNTRMYLAGFSNGGQMAARCAVQMSDIFAAVAECAGSFANDTTCIAMHQIPTWFEIGNLDQHLLTDSISSVPMSAFEFAINQSAFGREVVHSHASTFGLDTSYVLTGDSNSMLTATYPGSTATPTREFRFTLIKNLDHQYPNGINHPINGPEIQWAWFQNYRVQ